MCGRTIRFGLIFAFSLAAAAQSRNHHDRIPLDDDQFESCSQVEQIARAFHPSNPDHVFTLELFSKSKRSFADAFWSDSPLTQVTQWIRSTQPNAYPFAMFYAVDGDYHLRCRDARNHLMELAGSGGDPLRFEVRGGEVQILHFDTYNASMLHVYMVSGVPLENIDAPDLLSRVTQRLHARYVFLYIRRDPWFYRYSLDSTPYIFVDASKMISEEAYRASKTLGCSTGNACRLGESWP